MKIVKNTIIYTLGDIFSKLIPFLLLPYFTRKLTVEEFGELSLYQTIISLVIIFISMTQGGCLTKYYFKYGGKSVGLALSNSYIYTLFMTMLLAVFSLCFGNEIYVLLIIVAFSSEIFNAQLIIKLCKNQSQKYVIFNMLSGLLSAIFTVIIFEFYKVDVIYRFICIISFNFIISLIIFFNEKNSVKYRYSIKKRIIGYKYIFINGIPLALMQLTVFVKGQIDRFFIVDHYSLEQLAIYSAAFQISLIFPVLFLAINKAIMPSFYRKMKIGDFNIGYARLFVAKLLLLIPCIYMIILLIPESIYLKLLGENFNGIKYYLLAFCIGHATLPAYLMITNFFVFNDKNIYVTISTIVSSILYLLYLFYFSKIGIKYIPYGIFISNVTSIFILLTLIRKIKKRDKN